MGLVKEELRSKIQLETGLPRGRVVAESRFHPSFHLSFYWLFTLFSSQVTDRVYSLGNGEERGLLGHSSCYYYTI